MDVFTIDRCDEASIDPRPHIVREDVSLVLDRLDRGDVLIEAIGLVEQAIEQPRCFLQALGEFVEQNEKAFVAWNETHGVSSEVAEATRRPRLRRGAGFVT